MRGGVYTKAAGAVLGISGRRRWPRGGGRVGLRAAHARGGERARPVAGARGERGHGAGGGTVSGMASLSAAVAAVAPPVSEMGGQSPRDSRAALTFFFQLLTPVATLRPTRAAWWKS